MGRAFMERRPHRDRSIVLWQVCETADCKTGLVRVSGVSPGRLRVPWDLENGSIRQEKGELQHVRDGEGAWGPQGPEASVARGDQAWGSRAGPRGHLANQAGEFCVILGVLKAIRGFAAWSWLDLISIKGRWYHLLHGKQIAYVSIFLFLEKKMAMFKVGVMVRGDDS